MSGRSAKDTFVVPHDTDARKNLQRNRAVTWRAVNILLTTRHAEMNGFFNRFGSNRLGVPFTFASKRGRTVQRLDTRTALAMRFSVVGLN